jgi:LysR family cys regulon transcriptional activator
MCASLYNCATAPPGSRATRCPGGARDVQVNLQQLRYLCAVVDHGLNVSGAAEALYTSQPGISKQVRQLEDELGVEVFVRQGKRLAALTPAGRLVVATARRALVEVANLKRVAEEFRSEDEGELAIATTHTQARYVLPRVLKAFAARYPKVRFVLHQGNPRQVAEETAAGEVDLGIATEALAEYPDLVTLPCYEWNRVVLVPNGHPLERVAPLTLEAIARYPIVTYDFAFTGRSQANAAFSARGLEPNVVLTALDADVIKTYVSLGMGVGLVAQMAYDPERDAGLACLDASHLFPPSTTRLALRRKVFLRGYVYAFIGLFAPRWDRAAVDAALEGARAHPS